MHSLPVLMLRPFCLLASFLIFVPVWASGQDTPGSPPQDDPDPKLWFGFRAGYSQYTMAGTEVDLVTQPGADQLQAVTGFTAGGVVRRRLYKPLSVQGELLYVRQGGDFTRRVFPGKTNYAIGCLQIPLLLDLRLGGPSGPALHLQGGLAAVLPLKGVELDLASYDQGNQFSNPSAWLARAYGAELAWARNGRVYSLSARATQDLEDFFQRKYRDTEYNARSNGFSLTAGVLFAR